MTRRMTLLVLALLGLMVVVVTLSPPNPGARRGAQTPTATPHGSPVAPDLDDFDVQAQLSTNLAAKPRRIEAVLGDRVRITVEGSTPASVALGEWRIEQLEQGLPARFDLLAETPGTYPLVDLENERRIGTLEIR